MGGDGQVSMGDTVMKADAVKIRRLMDDRVLVGFAGSAADAFALMERLEAKLKDYPANLPRAATELAKGMAHRPRNAPAGGTDDGVPMLNTRCWSPARATSSNRATASWALVPEGIMPWPPPGRWSAQRL